MVDLRVHTTTRFVAGECPVNSSVGRVAQLGERCVRNAEVGSSILPASTSLRSREASPKRELRLGEPSEGCRAVAARQRARLDIRRVSRGNQLALRARHDVEAFRLCAQDERHNTALLRRGDEQRRATGGLAQPGTLPAHGKVPALAVSRYRGVLRRGARDAIRAIPEIRIRPSRRKTPFRLRAKQLRRRMSSPPRSTSPQTSRPRSP